jgi:hypothetical protein
MGDERGVGWALAGLGVVALHQGDYDRATALLRQSLVLRRKQGDKRAIAQVLERFAEVAGARGAPRRAARLFGAAHTLREAIGAPRMAAERADYERQMTAMRFGPEADALEALCAEGCALPVEDAIAYALQEPLPTEEAAPGLTTWAARS